MGPTLYSHRIHILNSLHQKITIKNYQEHSKFILLKMKLLLPLKHQNHMSNSLPTLTLTTDLELLPLLSFSWVFNLEDLKPKLNIFWYTFSLEKGKPYHNYNLNLFRHKVKIFWLMTKQDKQPTSQVNASQNFKNWNTYNYTWLHLNYSIEILKKATETKTLQYTSFHSWRSPWKPRDRRFRHVNIPFHDWPYFQQKL